MNNDSRIMKTPYENLRQKRNNPSKPYLMLSELIDNSIGSWVLGGKEYDLSVIVTINQKKRTIEVTDNAYGMNSEELLDSVELNKEKTGNVMNMFGVGMKNAAFWFGQDLLIRTNDGNTNSATSVLMSKLDKGDFNKPIEWRLEDWRKKPLQGTSVTVLNVYDDKILSNAEMAETVDILEAKYRKYLEGIGGHRLKMTLAFIDSKGKVAQPLEFEPKPAKAQIIPAKKVAEFIKNINNEFEDEAEIIRGIKQIVIEKAMKGLPLDFLAIIPFNGDELHFELGVLSQPDKGTNDSRAFKPNFGITAYQKDRAIRIAGVNPIKFGPTHNYTRTNIKRAFGFVELGDEFRPDNNKQDFNFGIHKGDFEAMMNKIGNDMIKLCDAVFATVGRTKLIGAGNPEATRKKIELSLKGKSKGFEWKKVSRSGVTAQFKDEDGEEWSFEIHERHVKDVEDKGFFVFAEIDNAKDKFINIYYNVNHPIWKPLANNNSSIDMKTVTYPLIAIMGLSQIGIAEDLFTKWMGMDEENDFLRVMSVISKFGLKID